MRICKILYFYISMFCTDTCHKQPLGEVLHSVEICFVPSLLKTILQNSFIGILSFYQEYLSLDIPSLDLCLEWNIMWPPWQTLISKSPFATCLSGRQSSRWCLLESIYFIIGPICQIMQTKIEFFMSLVELKNCIDWYLRYLSDLS